MSDVVFPHVEVRCVQTGGVVRRVAMGRTSTVFEAVQRAGMALHNSCGGMGTCGECVVDVLEGGEDLPPPLADEVDLLEDDCAQGRCRLACRIGLPPGRTRLVIAVELDDA